MIFVCPRGHPGLGQGLHQIFEAVDQLWRINEFCDQRVGAELHSLFCVAYGVAYWKRGIQMLRVL